MKPIIEKVIVPEEYSFSTESIELPYFKSKWHFHEKVEIIYIYDSAGMGFIGDGSTMYSKSVVSIIGSSVPHVWLNRKEYYKPDSGLVAKGIVIKFKEDFLGETFLKLNGLQLINDLIYNRSKRGILYKNRAKGKIAKLIKEIVNKTSDFERILLLLRVLQEMAITTDFHYVSSMCYSNMTKSFDHERLDKVFKYVMEHYNEKIELNEIAQIANLSPSAFCKFFKSRTLKTFTKFLNEVRIGHACKLLMDENVKVNEACYMSGFQYLSNFYKQFEAIHHMTPLEFKKRFFNIEEYSKPHLQDKIIDVTES